MENQSPFKIELNPLVDLKFVMGYVGFGKTYVYNQIKKGNLPKPDRIGRNSRWKFSDVEKLKNTLISSQEG